MGNAPSGGDVTQLLARARSGEKTALGELFTRVYDELRSIAHRKFAAERRGHTLQPTAVVNEAWLKMVGARDALGSNIRDRSTFLAAAARAMRQILIDHARGHDSLTHGGGAPKMPIREDDAVTEPRSVDILALLDALERLEKSSPRAARVVELRYLAGCTVNEVGVALGVSEATVNRDWQYAQARLKQELAEDD